MQIAENHAQPTPEEYPHLFALVNGMSESGRTLAVMYLIMLPTNVLEQIEQSIPSLIEMETNNDEAGLYTLLRAFGADDDTARQLLAMRHGE